MDTNNPNPNQWQQYELPINLLHQNWIMTGLVHPQGDDYWELFGLNMSIESNKEHPDIHEEK